MIASCEQSTNIQQSCKEQALFPPANFIDFVDDTCNSADTPLLQQPEFDFGFGDMDCEFNLESDLTTDEAIIHQLSKDIHIPSSVSNALTLSNDSFDAFNHLDFVNTGIKSERSSPVSSPDSAFDSNSGDDWSPSESPPVQQDSSYFEMFLADPSSEILSAIEGTDVKIEEQGLNSNLLKEAFDIVMMPVQNTTPSPVSTTEATNKSSRESAVISTPSNINSNLKIVTPVSSFVSQASSITLHNANPMLMPKPKAKPADVKSDLKIINKTINSKDGSSKFILTAEEFNKLTSQGLIKIKSPQSTNAVQNISVAATSNQVPIQHTTLPCVANQNIVQPLISGSHVVSSVNNISAANQVHVADKRPLPAIAPRFTTIVDEKNFKKQQRMIKNRESASLSRKKKKEHVTSLESCIEKLSEENQRLYAENYSLKTRIAQLEEENMNYKKYSKLPNAKATTFVLAVLFVVGINLNYFDVRSPLQNQKHVDSLTNKFVRHHANGRSLLSVPSDPIEDSNVNSSINDIMDNMPKNSSNDCPPHINSTESQRHYSVITSWLKENSRLEFKKAMKLKNFRYPSWPFIEDSAFNKRTNSSIFLPNLNNMKWALAFNKSSETNSQLSFIMSASLSEGDLSSLPDDYPKVIQIDCVVTNTKTFLKSYPGTKSNNTYGKQAKARKKELRKKRLNHV